MKESRKVKKLWFSDKIGNGDELFNCNICREYSSVTYGRLWKTDEDDSLYQIFICDNCFNLDNHK